MGSAVILGERKGADKSYAVVIVTADSKDQPFSFAFTPGRPDRKKWSIRKLTPSTSEDLIHADKDLNPISVMVPARDGLVLQFK